MLYLAFASDGYYLSFYGVHASESAARKAIGYSAGWIDVHKGVKMVNRIQVPEREYPYSGLDFFAEEREMPEYGPNDPESRPDFEPTGYHGKGLAQALRDANWDLESPIVAEAMGFPHDKEKE